MKLIGSVLTLLVSQFANAQIQSGTIVVFQLIDGKLIVAADSRGIFNGKPRDKYCKISAFRDKVIFAVAGNSASIPPVPGWRAWDATVEARIAVAHTRFAKQKTSEELVNKVADDWGVRMKKNWDIDLRQHPEVIKQISEANHGLLTNGLFAAAINGNIAIAPRAIALVDGSIKAIVPIDARGCVTPCAVGETDIFMEYVGGRTPRSAQEKWSASPVDRIIRLVELQGTLQQPNAAGIRGVGGPTDALELWKDGSIHWIRLKSNCPKNKN